MDSISNTSNQVYTKMSHLIIATQILNTKEFDEMTPIEASNYITHCRVSALNMLRALDELEAYVNNQRFKTLVDVAVEEIKNPRRSERLKRNH